MDETAARTVKSFFAFLINRDLGKNGNLFLSLTESKGRMQNLRWSHWTYDKTRTKFQVLAFEALHKLKKKPSFL